LAGGGDSPLSIIKGGPTTTAVMETMVGGEAGGDEHESGIRSSSCNRGTPAFVSKTRIASDCDPLPLRSPDKFYYPYNENEVAQRIGKGAYVDFSKDLPRECSTRPIARPCAPDVIYSVNNGCGSQNIGGVPFSRQLSRNGALRALAKRVYPALTSASYNIDDKASSQFRRHTCSALFGKCTGRKEAPSIMQRRSVPDSRPHYDIRDYERINVRHIPAASFRHQTSRPSMQKSLDLSYDRKNENTIKFPSSPTARLQFGSGHNDESVHPTLTSGLDYTPQYSQVTPAMNPGPSFEKAEARSPTHNSVLDKFYDVDTPLTTQRIKGDPMLHKHVSRDKRNTAFSVRTMTPDKFYDYDVNKVLPGSPRGMLEFNKGKGRDTSANR
jgi:hypothetical protein